MGINRWAALLAPWAVGVVFVACDSSPGKPAADKDVAVDIAADGAVDIAVDTAVDTAVSDSAAGTDAGTGSDGEAATDAVLDVLPDAELPDTDWTDAALQDQLDQNDAATTDSGAAATDAQALTDALQDADAQADTPNGTDAQAGTDAAGATDSQAGSDAQAAACSDASDCSGQSDDLCAGPWQCVNQQCVQGPAVLCDTSADTACNQTVCDPKTGQCAAKPVANDTPCDDGNPCTADDACQFGACVGPLEVCQCQKSADCQKYDDGNPCNGTLYCEAKSKTCVTNPASVVVCNTSQDGPCERTSCQPQTGQCAKQPRPDGTACSDDNSCTAGDICSAGSCAPGTQTCCQTDADCVAADDGNLCNGTLFCNKASGKCQLNPTTIVNCASVDDTDCKKNVCQPKTGQCVLTAVANGKPCDDGSACTPSETCQNGQCTAGANLCACQTDGDCKAEDDGNLCNGVLYCNLQKSPAVCEVNPASLVVCADNGAPCADPACNPLTGGCEAAPVPDGTPCDQDGSACTPGDVCLAGSCQAGANLCDCNTDLDCAAKEDGDLCNGTLYCNKLAGKCEVNPASVVRCPYGDDTACVQNRCDKATGTCSMQPIREGASCDADGNPCTAGDTCEQGSCVAGPNTCPCTSSGQCAPYDDANACNGTLYCDVQVNVCVVNPASVVVCPGTASACQQNSCDPLTGQCAVVAAYDGQWCDADGNPCTLQDICSSGQCTPGANVCQCTSNNDCAAREDGDVCNGSLYCDFAQPPFVCAVNPATVISCPTGLDTACSKTSCDKATGQCMTLATPDGGPCEDGSSCTTADVCIGGVCLGDQRSCNDGDPCTVDACSALTGLCIHKFTACGDGNPCTTDSCDPQNGCQNVQLPSGVTCSDGNACTTADACQSGQCKGIGLACDDANPCTLDTCTVSGGCVFQARPNGSACSDGSLCTTGDTCLAGACSGAPVVCSDNNPCTDDACDPQSGDCVVSAATGPCNDGDACSQNDACSGGFCLGSPIVCDDLDPCTQDACLGGLCTYLPSSGPCEDGSACTQNDACSDGLCVGADVVCSDGNLCTDDGCDPQSGCVFVLNQTPCNDGNACTEADTCTQGACSGQALVCNDGNACTDDSCSKAKGCVFAASTKPCDDGDACTASSVCASTVCKSLASTNCDDGVACTLDSCNSQTGCVHTVNPAVCNDNNPCTQDLCDGGCVHPPLDDGAPCGGEWQCLQGSCKYARDFALSAETGCLVRPDGTVRCWGLGNEQQLGDGKAGNVGGKPWFVTHPADTLALANKVERLTPGWKGFFAHHPDGKLSYWGSNASGKAGLDTLATNVSPTQLALSDVKLVASGLAHSCAVTTAGTAYCWGSGNLGQLLQGPGNTANTKAPQQVGVQMGLGGIGGLVVTETNTCWLDATTVRCAGGDWWGHSSGTAVATSSQPSPVSPYDGMDLLAAGDGFVCGRDLTGAVRCWGLADHGRTGGTTNAASGTRTPAPRLIAGTQDTAELQASGDTACIRTTSGKVKCWGACGYGHCGNQSSIPQYAAREIEGLPAAARLRLGVQTACAEDTVGQLWCWGNGSSGELGNGTSGSNVVRAQPVLMPASQLPGAVLCASTATCDDHDPCTTDTCTNGACASAPVADGTACGDGRTCAAGQCRHAVQLAAGDDHTCLVQATGELLCWGRGDKGQLGTGGAQPQLAVPTKVVGLGTVTAVAAERDTTCAISGGEVWCWGDVTTCELGAEVTSASALPVRIAGLTGQVEVAVGQGMVCSRSSQGAVRCWGQLGGVLPATPSADPCVPQLLTVPSGLPPTRVDLAGTVAHVFTPNGSFVWGLNTSQQLKPGGPDVYTAIDEIAPWYFVRDMDGNGQTLCSASSFGGLACSGANAFGEAGAAPSATTPPDGLWGAFDSAGVRSVAVGGHHACGAAKADGRVRCWGSDADGQLGDGPGGGSGFVSAQGIIGAETVVAGRAHTCALRSTGEVWCWGDGSAGQLGNSQFGSGIGSATPLRVALTASSVPADACDVAGVCDDANPCTTDACDRATGSCVHTPTGNGAACAGGQCSAGVCTAPEVVDLAAGDEFTCVLRKNGSVWCWGLGNLGQLGNGQSQPSSLVPVQVQGLDGATELAAAGARACAIRYGQAVCWGSGADGALGNGSTPPNNALAPVAVTGTNPLVELSMGARHVCARDNIGQVWCWGYNSDGRLGNGTTSTSPTPAPQLVQGLLGPAKQVAVSDVTSCALLSDGRIQCWGADSGRLGVKPSATQSSTAYTPIANLPSAAVQVAATNVGGCALVQDGSVWCWALGVVEAWQYGGVSDLPAYGQPYAAVPALAPGALAVQAAANTTCVLLGNRGVSCWGGHGSTASATGYAPPDTVYLGAPGRVFGLADAVQVAVGSSHSCARVASGEVWCWGENSVGQLGTGNVLGSGSGPKKASVVSW